MPVILVAIADDAPGAGATATDDDPVSNGSGLGGDIVDSL